MNPKVLLAVVGPTALGKTALGIRLAQHFQTEIIAADSRQFFKEMHIGTAVPSPEELSQVPHHFVQHKSIFEPYSVGDFEQEALQRLQLLFQEKAMVLMVGGSGLYVDAVAFGLDLFPKVDPKLREALNRQYREEGLESLQRELQARDPEYYTIVDRNNPHRLIRALEVSITANQPYSSFLNQHRPKRPFHTLYVGLTAPRAVIYERINTRVDRMLAAGLLEEAKTLYPYRKLNALQTVGYRELFAYLDGQITLEVAISEIKKNTRRFAKRQLTWLRKHPNILWIDYETPTAAVIKKITAQCKSILQDS